MVRANFGPKPHDLIATRKCSKFPDGVHAPLGEKCTSFKCFLCLKKEVTFMFISSDRAIVAFFKAANIFNKFFVEENEYSFGWYGLDVNVVLNNNNVLIKFSDLHGQLSMYRNRLIKAKASLEALNFLRFKSEEVDFDEEGVIDYAGYEISIKLTGRKAKEFKNFFLNSYKFEKLGCDAA